jgi:hypothetical protein
MPFWKVFGGMTYFIENVQYILSRAFSMLEY